MQFVHARTGSFARPDFAPKRVAGQVSADLERGFVGAVGPRGFMRRGPTFSHESGMYASFVISMAYAFAYILYCIRSLTL